MHTVDNFGAQPFRDVLVVGGGAAGLSAALTLARSRRSVTVFDAGQPRNAPASAVHGLLGLDGIAPAELSARGRGEVLGYGGEIADGEVVAVGREGDLFTVTSASGSVVRGRRLLIATGLVDELPDVAGVREQWGRGVVHCPYCHGWEIRDTELGVLATDPIGLHKVALFRQWSPDLTAFVGEQDLDSVTRTQFDVLGITVVAGAVARVESEAERLTGVVMQDGRAIPLEALAVSTRLVARASLFAGIGIETTQHPMGEFIETDAAGRTKVDGVWAAGNASDLSAQVGSAAAAGAVAGQGINADLIAHDTARAVAAHNGGVRDLAAAGSSTQE